jgi:DNA-binding NarL/FixJ family response regulator
MTSTATQEPDGQIRVLIADDNGSFRSALQKLIDRQPELAVVAAARDGLEAIELAEALSPDAVVIDLHMPLLDGVTAAARLRHDHPNLCLIALTGDDAPALHQAAREAGADEVLLKNELMEALLDRLAAARTRRSSG